MSIKHEQFITRNGSAIYRLLFLIPNTDPTWFPVVYDELAAAGYQLHRLPYTELTKHTLDSAHPDAIIADYDKRSVQFFKKLATTQNDLRRPLRILVTELAHDAWDEAIADLIVAPIPGQTVCQLRTCLRLRAQALEQHEHVQTLQQQAQLYQMQIELQQRSTDEVNLLKNAIVRNVSHELKTPLLQLKSAISLLAEDTENNKLIEYATGATARLEGLVKNITQLASSLDINLGPVIIREIIDQAIRNLRRSWEHKDTVSRVQMQLEDNLPVVLGDKQGLSTVLQLLLANALKFSDEIVEISATQVGSSVCISVHDYGIGIPEDQIEKIFELFYQADNSSTRRYGGAGVGLAIVRLILERHQVAITVNSEPGKGSTFTFFLRTLDSDGFVLDDA